MKIQSLIKSEFVVYIQPSKYITQVKTKVYFDEELRHVRAQTEVTQVFSAEGQRERLRQFNSEEAP